MLPRMATTTGASQASLALQAGGSLDAAVKPQPSAAALANLRAEVLLRLLETMLRHMPHTSERPGRDLLETLLATLKAGPGRGGENGRKLADLLAKLPPELRPRVEKLIGTVLSSMPTRSLVEVVRNPQGPEAQKLAALLAASLDVEDLPAAGAERRQKPLGLTTQQLAAVGRSGPQQTVPAEQAIHDARALQTALKRIFDLDSGDEPRPATARAAAMDAARPALATADRQRAETQTDRHMPASKAKVGNAPPAEAAEAVADHDASAEEPQATTAISKREDRPAGARVANPAGQALARSVLHAITRDMPTRLLMQAVAHLAENLSPEEANFLRALLERPLDPANAERMSPIGAGRPEVAIEPAADTEMPAEGGRTQPETTQSTPASPRHLAEQDDLPLPRGRETAQAAAIIDAATPDRLFPAAVAREGVPLAFVPYLPAEDDLDWTETRGAEEEDPTEEDQPGGEGREEAGEEADFEASAGEPEADDMVLRREKAAEMVGVIEPGLVFYQKLGDYWT